MVSNFPLLPKTCTEGKMKYKMRSFFFKKKKRTMKIWNLFHLYIHEIIKNRITFTYKLSNRLSDSRAAIWCQQVRTFEKTTKPLKGKLVKVYGSLFCLPTKLVVQLQRYVTTENLNSKFKYAAAALQELKYNSISRFETIIINKFPPLFWIECLTTSVSMIIYLPFLAST